MTWLRLALVCLIALPAAAASAGAKAPKTVKPIPADAFTAVLMRPVASKTAAVPGDDGRYHVVYELWLTNGKAVPATFDRVDVLDADDQSRVVRSLSGDVLASATFYLNGRPSPGTTLAQDESKLVFIELTFDGRRDVPKGLVHRLTGTGAAIPAAREPSAMSFVSGFLALDRYTPPELGPPLKGKGWIVVNGCCKTAGAHRSAMQTVNGALDNSQRFAIDWIKLDDLGRMVAGDPKVLTNWVGYGEPLFAAIDGVVVSTRNDLDNQPPGQLPDPASITAETALGNHVILDIGRGNFLFYAHMKKGSVTVRKGDRVHQGKELGRLGNSGNTSAPHLHIQVMDSPSALGATGLPCVYRSFTLTGTINPVKWDAAPDQSGVWGNRGTFKPVKNSHDLPLDLHILDWHER